MHAMSPKELQALPLFSGLAISVAAQLLSVGRERACPRGSLLFAHGDAVTHFYLVTQGAVRLFRTTPDGNEKTVELLRAGQTIGESEIMDACHGHRVNAQAVEDVTVLEFPVSWLKESARNHGEFALNLLSQISSQAHLAQLEAEHQATMSAAQLVACFLQRLCVLHGFDPKGFELPYSKTLIASRLGMEVETFSRTLARLKDHGIIVKGSQVAITDLARIEEYVCSVCSIADHCATHQALEAKTHS